MNTKNTMLAAACIAALGVSTVASAGCKTSGTQTQRWNAAKNDSKFKNQSSHIHFKNGRIEVKPSGNVTSVGNALKLGTEYGLNVRIAGWSSGATKVYTVKKPINVTMHQHVNVYVPGNVTFRGDKTLAGDIFGFKSSDSSFNCFSGKIDFTWNGGRFDMTNQPNSTVVPGPKVTLSNTADRQKYGSNKDNRCTSCNSEVKNGKVTPSSTADALSVRGHAGNRQKLNHYKVSNVTVTAGPSDKDFRFAGGDSGLLMISAEKATVTNNRFNTIRDAGVYLSSNNLKTSGEGNLGTNSDYTLRNNKVYRAFDGLTVKRGVKKITFDDNDITDTLVGLSTKPNSNNNAYNTNQVIATNNDIVRFLRGISLERTETVTIDNNRLKSMGSTIKGFTAKNKNGFKVGGKSRYEAISLNGVKDGTVTIKNNTIEANKNDGDRMGIVYRKFNGRTTPKPSETNTTWKNIHNSRKIIQGDDA